MKRQTKISIAHSMRTRSSVKRHALAVFAILSLLCASSASAKKEHQWRTGSLLGIYETKVDAQSLKTAQNPTPYAPKDLVNDTYTIDGGEYTYQCAEIRKTKNQPPPFTVDASIQFAVEAEHVFLKDDQGKEHDTKLVVRRRKAPAGNSQ